MMVVAVGFNAEVLNSPSDERLTAAGISARGGRLTRALDCLVVSGEASRRQRFTAAAELAGWDECSSPEDLAELRDAADRDFSLAIIDITSPVGEVVSDTVELAEELAARPNTLVVICGLAPPLVFMRHSFPLFPHYFITALPALYIAAGVALNALVPRFRWLGWVLLGSSSAAQIGIWVALLVFLNTPAGSAIDNNIMKFVFATPGIVLAQVTIISALAIRLLKSTFDRIDPRYEQVGRTLGCSKLKAFLKITLPLAKDGIIASAILTWARAVGEFGATVTLAGATPMKTETLPVAIFLSLASADIGKATAVIFVLIVIAVVALLIIRKVFGRRYPI